MFVSLHNNGAERIKNEEMWRSEETHEPEVQNPYFPCEMAGKSHRIDIVWFRCGKMNKGAQCKMAYLVKGGRHENQDDPVALNANNIWRDCLELILLIHGDGHRSLSEGEMWCYWFRYRYSYQVMCAMEAPGIFLFFIPYA